VLFSQVVSSNETQAQEDDPHTSRMEFEPSLYQCFENCGSLKLTVARHGGDPGVTVKVCSCGTKETQQIRSKRVYERVFARERLRATLANKSTRGDSELHFKPFSLDLIFLITCFPLQRIWTPMLSFLIGRWYEGEMGKESNGRLGYTR